MTDQIEDFDDPKIEQTWCDKQRTEISIYLQREKIPHAQIGEWPAWHIAPHVAIWAIESASRPNLWVFRAC